MIDLLTEITDGVGILTLNRPDRLNALSDEMIAGLATTLAEWESDDRVGAIVVTGAGGAFCAGGDLMRFAETGGLNHGATDVDPARVAWLRDAQEKSIGAVTSHRKPTVAAIEGAAAGAGLGLALACDLRVGSEQSVFTAAFTGVGLSGDFGVTWLLTRTVGPARARHMLLMSDKVHGQQALTWGLLNWLVEPADVRGWAIDRAARLAAGPRFALSQVKRNLAHAETNDLTSSLHFEAQTQMESATTQAHGDAVAAFAQRSRH